MFSPEQKRLLAEPLDRSHVKTRDQSGRKLSYVEGWHVIAEANRIFGFDAWSRETVEIRCVSEKERTIGASKAPGFGVTYVARVRVTIGGVVRDGCGSGHGIDRDLGQAHESAIKEAETDAMKRALMTFGNPFGLALYDKEQTHVSDANGKTADENPFAQDESVAVFIKTAKARIAAFTDADALIEWWRSDEQKATRATLRLSQTEVDDLKAAVIARRDQLSQKAA